VGTYGHTVLAQLLRSSDEDEDADEEEDEDEDEDEASSTSITPCLSPMSPMSPVAPWGGALPGKEPPSMPPATDPASPPSSEPPWWCRTTPPRGKDTPSLSPRKSEFRLRAGQRVTTHSGCMGTVRFVGRALFAPGLWVGVELDEPRGHSDGSFGGEECFRCSTNHGLFVRPHMLDKVSTIHTS